MTAIILSDLPEAIQTLLSQAQTTGENLTITKNGIPVAIVSQSCQGFLRRNSELIPALLIWSMICR